jgi:ABC-type transport system involved in multi-copper enzyme maturation permease subunit
MRGLLQRSAAQARYVLGGALLLLFGFQLIIVGQASEIERTQSFGRLADLIPAFLQRGLGSRAMLMATFRGTVAFGYFHPVICAVLAIVAVYLTTEPAHEIESGLVDLELARAVPRHRLLTRSLLLALAAVTAGLTAMFAGTSFGARLFDAPLAELPETWLRLQLLANLGALALCFAGLGLWLGATARRWSTAFTTAALVVVVTYLLDFLAIGWPPMRWIAWVSPFHYYPALSVVAGDASVSRNLLVLLSAAVAFAAAAYVQFQRRDL